MCCHRCRHCYHLRSESPEQLVLFSCCKLHILTVEGYCVVRNGAQFMCTWPAFQLPRQISAHWMFVICWRNWYEKLCIHFNKAIQTLWICHCVFTSTCIFNWISVEQSIYWLIPPLRRHRRLFQQSISPFLLPDCRSQPMNRITRNRLNFFNYI